MTTTIELDGAMGEGGGQILRSALSLSLCLQRPVRLFAIRARRRRPGLRPQHLAAVQAAAELGGARVEGARPGAQTLAFEPGRVAPGTHRFDIGTAGSTTLVLQALLPALLTLEAPSEITVAGGTHNPLAPPFEFLQQAFLPVIGAMGPQVTAELLRPGFYPAGGGEIRLRVSPVAALRPLCILDRGRLLGIRATALVARLPRHIARRELETIGRALDLPGDRLAVVQAGSARSPGNAVSVRVEHEGVTEVFTGLGRRGLPAEAVALGVLRQVQDYLAGRAPVGEHLADQLLIPLALAGGAFRTVAPSLHTRTNIDVIRRITGKATRCREVTHGLWELSAGPPG